MKKITQLFFTFLFIGITGFYAQNTRNALAFDGAIATSLVDCGSSPNFSPSIFTIEFWGKTQANAGTFLSNVEYINGGDGARGFTVRMASDNSGRIDFVMGIDYASGDWVNASSSEALTFDKWTHIAITYDGAEVKMFFNGEPAGTLANTKNILTSTNKLYFGEHPFWVDRRLSGELSDVRIWSVARTESEIKANMNDFLTCTESGLVANWKLNEGTGTVINEQVNNANGTAGVGTSWKTNQVLSTDSFSIDRELALYPNPSKVVFKINSKFDTKLDYKIYSITGKFIKKGTFNNDNDTLDLTALSTGIYIFEGLIANNSFTKKLILE